MLIGIMSDSHDNLECISKAVKTFNKKKVGRVIHAGDISSASSSNNFKDLACPMDAVFGNCDTHHAELTKAFKGIAQFHATVWEPVFEGFRFYVTHKNGLADMMAASDIFDCVIHGHTHHPRHIKNGKTVVINPGETTTEKTGQSTVAILELPSFKVEFIELK